LTENITQATARDLLAEAMLRAEARGYPVIGTIHDEIICEVKHPAATELEKIMIDVPAWAKDLPISAEAYESERYG